MNWQDFFFIVNVSVKCSYARPYAGESWIIVNRETGEMERPVFFRTERHALRSVKRLMQQQEIVAERAILE